MHTPTLLVLSLASASLSHAQGARGRLAKRDVTAAAAFYNRFCNRWQNPYFQTFNWTPVGPTRSADQLEFEWEAAALIPMTNIVKHIVREGLRTPMSTDEFDRIAQLGAAPLADLFRTFSNNNGILDTTPLYSTTGCGGPESPCPPVNMENTIPGAIQKFLFDYASICQNFAFAIYPQSATCTTTSGWRINPHTGLRDCSFNPNSLTTGASLDPLEVLRRDGYFGKPMWETVAASGSLNVGVSGPVWVTATTDATRPPIYNLRRTVPNQGGNLPDSKFTLNGGYTPQITPADFSLFGGLSTASGTSGLRGWPTSSGVSAASRINQATTDFINSAFRISGAISRAVADPNWPQIRAALATNTVTGICAAIQCVCKEHVVSALHNPQTQEMQATGGTLPATNLTYTYWPTWARKPHSQSEHFASTAQVSWNPVCTAAHVHPQSLTQCCPST